jgi:lipopolysaccharide transport system permease protein
MFHFALFTIKVRFGTTRLGLIWTGLEPLLTFVLLYAVFTSIRISSQENFAIYLLSGITIFHIFTRGTMAGLSSLDANKGIINSFNIRREFFPTVSTMATGLLVFVEIAVFLCLLVFFQFTPEWTIILLPIPIFLLLILILGFSYILSIINTYIRDIKYIWSIITGALFFVSPIFWYVDEAKQILLSIHQFNPLGQILEIFHKLVVFGELPTLSEWIHASLFSFVILVLGFAVFQKYHDKITEEL